MAIFLLAIIAVVLVGRFVNGQWGFILAVVVLVYAFSPPLRQIQNWITAEEIRKCGEPVCNIWGHAN